MGFFAFTHQRMKDRFKPVQGALVAKDKIAQGRAVDAAMFDEPGNGFGKGLLYKGNRLASFFHQMMNGPVGLMHGTAKVAQHGRGRGFSHAYGPGKPGDDHVVSPLRRSASSISRNSEVASGRTPNHASKVGRA